MRVTVVGGGNIGTQFAVHFAAAGHEVTVSTSRPQMFSDVLEIVDGAGAARMAGRIALATADDSEAFAEADLVLVTVPAFGMPRVAERLGRFARPGMLVGLIPGTGGAECAFGGCAESGASIFGIQRVPSVARLVEYGSRVCCEGYRDSLYLACLPRGDAERAAGIIEAVFGIPCRVLPNYLCVSLTPSNPILHTCRLRVLFGDYSAGMAYGRVPLFYEEWDDESSALLLACDAELQSLCRSLPELDLSPVLSLREHYESETAEAMTAKITSIDSLKGLASPTIAVEGGFAPDFSSRYFTADFPYGLELIVQAARLAGVSAPNMEGVLAWYWDVSPEPQGGFRYADWGVTSRESLVAFYDR